MVSYNFILLLKKLYVIRM